MDAEELSNLAKALVQEAERRGARLRLLGGLAFYLSSPQGAQLPSLKREYKDLDFAVDKKGARVAPQVFASQGWDEDRYFNALHGRTRLLFFYHGELQSDVFIGVFEQCHTLELQDRLALTSPTLPLSDLLLTKLQIHQLNDKDVQDTLAMLHDHDLGPSGKDGHIELDRIIGLAGNDWGWYTTLHDNLITIDGLLGRYVSGPDEQTIHNRLHRLREALEATPKSLKWKVRSQVGRRVPWYEEPEEVRR